MEKAMNWISVAIGIGGGILGKLFGGFDGMMVTLLCLMAADYITGWIKAICNKKLSSEVGVRGILKKALMLIIVGVAVMLQDMIGDTVPLRETAIMFYVANEGLSVLENAAEFIPLPDRLKGILIQVREKTEVTSKKNDK